jgi:serine protease Do
VRAGEWVVAIGSPFGFENTVTAGIVSATSRSSSRMAAAAQDGNNTRYGSFIQTDVAVNPGNSGGPLFNVNGEVIGINSQIYSGTGSYAGLSFAIPINLANSIREQLVSNGKVSRGRIGVTVGAVSPDLAESFGLDRARGAAVSTVIKDGPAAKAGIREEDVILSVNGRKIEAESELPEIVAAIKPGTKIDLEIWRDKSAKHVSVVVDEFSAGTATRTANTKSSGGGAGRAGAVEKLGLTVRTLTSSEQRQIGAEGGVYVEEVTGAAEEAGIQSGDVILSAGGKKLASAEDLRDAAKAGGVLRLRVQNESGIFLATVRPE